MAASFAGAVLASVPLISHHGGRTSYEGLGQQVPVASETPGAAGDGTATVTDGAPSLEPLRDPAQGTAGPVLPQVAPSPAAEGDDTHGAVPAPAPTAGPRIVHETSDGAAPRPAPAASGTQGTHDGRSGDPAGLLRPSSGKAAAHASGAGLGVLAGAGKNASAPATQHTGKPKPPAPSGTATVSAAGKPTGTATTRATPARAGTTSAGHAATPVRATTRATPATAEREWSTRVVNATTVLGPGESVASDLMKITMRTDGNLVITDENGTVRWSSHTEGTGHKAVFQDDGHFVVYTEGNGTAWSSGTAGNPGAQLVIQADGNVVIESRRRPVVAGTQH